MSPEEITTARKAAGLSQDELAALLGMSQTMLSRMEQGEREPEPGFRERLWSVLDLHERRRRETLARIGLVGSGTGN